MSATTAQPEIPWVTSDIEITSSIDHNVQPARAYLAPDSAKRPMIVFLHAWSATYQQRLAPDVEQWAHDQHWHIMAPDFRGPSWNASSCASDLAIQDVLDAVAYARQHAAVDDSRIYLVGCSGGGHFAMMMAARHPLLWAGVSAWVGISDLAKWHAHCCQSDVEYIANYAKHIASACGGKPGSSPAVDAQLARRSPITWLKPGLPCILDINAGIHDGHTGSVPISHSLEAFNAVADPADRIAPADIAIMTSERRIPDHLQAAPEDHAYGAKPVLFRRSSGRARVTIFAGGHELLQKPLRCWLEKLNDQR